MASGIRSTGSTTISFGMVSIPVKFYKATDTHDLGFNLMHGPCKARLTMPPMVCSACKAEVGRDVACKGHEFAKGQYVIFTPEEMQGLAEPAAECIDIQEFIPASEVDPLCFETTQHIGPDKGAGRSYRLLVEAMVKAGRVAIAKWATRGKDKLVMVRSVGGRLMLHTLLYSDEVRATDGIECGEDTPPRAGELDLACKLIDNLAVDHFDHARFTDGYVARMVAAIEQKSNGQAVTIAPVKTGAVVLDLMAALTASLAKPAKSDTAAAPKRARKAA